MFPIDSEFTILYMAYIIMFIFLLFGILKSSNKAFYKWNFIVFGMYLLIMMYQFLDAENFSQGGSLFVLVSGALFVLSHFVVIVLIKLYQLVMKK